MCGPCVLRFRSLGVYRKSWGPGTTSLGVKCGTSKVEKKFYPHPFGPTLCIPLPAPRRPSSGRMMLLGSSFLHLSSDWEYDGSGRRGTGSGGEIYRQGRFLSWGQRIIPPQENLDWVSSPVLKPPKFLTVESWSRGIRTGRQRP